MLYLYLHIKYMEHFKYKNTCIYLSLSFAKYDFYVENFNKNTPSQHRAAAAQEKKGKTFSNYLT